MAKILTGPEVLQAVQRICSSGNICYLAVSNWSGKAAKDINVFFNSDAHVVLDVTQGGTSPKTLKELRHALKGRVRVLQGLHTKVVASKTEALVGSADITPASLQEPFVRTEACVLLTGSEAIQAFSFAKQLYEKSRQVTDKDIQTANAAFGRRTVAQSQIGKAKAKTFRNFLIEHGDCAAHYPMILTTGELDDKIVARAWRQQRAQLAPGLNDKEFDSNEWDCFDWTLIRAYDDRMCVAVHAEMGRRIRILLVRPFIISGSKMTFARVVDWKNMPEFNLRGKTVKFIDPVLDNIEIYKKIRELDRRRRSVLHVSDLIQALDGDDNKFRKSID